jgi:Putative transposase
LFPYNDKARESLCQYIARHPASLQKITYEPIKKKVLYHTKYNDYWKENLKLFTALDFIAELTQHIPPKHKHLIRYYGLYASRTKGKSRQDGRYEKFGIKKGTSPGQNEQDNTDYEEPTNKAGKQAWARLIKKVYEVDPFICPKCSSEMRIVAVIMDKNEIQKIIKHLDKKRAPPEEKKVS